MLVANLDADGLQALLGRLAKQDPRVSEDVFQARKVAIEQGPRECRVAFIDPFTKSIGWRTLGVELDDEGDHVNLSFPVAAVRNILGLASDQHYYSKALKRVAGGWTLRLYVAEFEGERPKQRGFRFGTPDLAISGYAFLARSRAISTNTASMFEVRGATDEDFDWLREQIIYLRSEQVNKHQTRILEADVRRSEQQGIRCFVMESDKATEYACEACGKKPCRLKCTGCQRVHYCNQTCQKGHWAVHKIVCKGVKSNPGVAELQNV